MSIAHMKLTPEQFEVLSPVLGDLCQIKLLTRKEVEQFTEDGTTLESDLSRLMYAVAHAFTIEEVMMLSGLFSAMLSMEGQSPVKVEVNPVTSDKLAEDGLPPGEETIFISRPRTAG